MAKELGVTISNYKQELKKANRLLLAKSDDFSDSNIDRAKSIYKQILSLGINDSEKSTVTVRKMLRLLEVLEPFLVGAHRNNKADIQNVADVLYYNKFYFSDCYKDLLDDLDETFFYWYDKAAEIGLASAYLKKARLCLYGCGVKQSLEEALNSYKKACEKSIDAGIIWNSIKNNIVSSRTDLADEVNVIKFYLYSEGLNNKDFSYNQDFEKAKETISSVTDISISKLLSGILANKIAKDKEKLINESIVVKTKEYEDLKKNINDINAQITKAKKLKQEFSSQLDKAKNDLANAEAKLQKMEGEVADKENNIVNLDKRIERMEIENSTLFESYKEKKQEVATLEKRILELGQKYEKMADDCSALEKKYVELKGIEETNRIIFNKCKMAAEQGNAKAQYDLAECYLIGKGTIKDDFKVAYWREKSAEQGYVEAQYELANYCYSGKDDKKAFFWYKKAAEQGHLKAQYELACCYQKGIGVEVDNVQAYFWFKKIAEKGYKDSGDKLVELELIFKEQDILYFNKQKEEAEKGGLQSQYEVAGCYYYGKGVDRDFSLAAYWYKKAAEQGYAKAQCELAYCYATGNGVLKSDHLAVYWFEKAARQGVAKAQYELGRCYVNGKGVTRNDYDAVYWFKRISDQSYKEAAAVEINNIQIRKSNEDNFKIETDKSKLESNLNSTTDKQTNTEFKEGLDSEKSYTNIEQDAGDGVSANQEFFMQCKEDAKNNDANAQFELAVCYETGKGVFKNGHLAIYWYEKAARCGIAAAQYELGKQYENGCVVTKDDYDANYWYRKAAENGNAAAQYKQGLHFENNENGQINPYQSFEWFKKAAEQGYVLAQLKLGKYYEKGIGTERNIEKAINCYKEAAEKGNNDALNNLAMCWVSDIETNFNSEEALYYYKKASEDGQKQIRERVLSDFQKFNTQDDYIEWLKFAAELGDANAQYQLGIKYYTGSGIERNKKQAYEWIAKAASKGNKEAKRSLKNGSFFDETYFDKLIAKAEQGDPEAQYEVAFSYETGVTKDDESLGITPSQAFSWYQKAAELGHAKAQFKLGLCYEEEKGTNKDYEKALYWYEKAKEQGIDEAGAAHKELLLKIEAEKGDAEAQYELALSYYKGNKGKKHLYKALVFFEKAAEQGHTKAQFMTGKFYEEGWGTARDISKAISWYEIVAEQGDSEAAQRIVILKEEAEQNVPVIKKHLKRLKKVAEENNIDVDKYYEQIKNTAEQGNKEIQKQYEKLKDIAEENNIDVDKHIEQVKKVAEQGNKELQKQYEKLKDKASENNIDMDKHVKQVKKWIGKIFE